MNKIKGESISGTERSSVFQDEEKSKLLQKLLQSKNPEDLQAANRLIKTMVKEVRYFAKARDLFVCDTVV